MCELSVIIPVYKSATIFPTLYKQLKDALDELNISYEILPVIDGENDNSWEVISAISISDEALKPVQLSRSFGQQSAITAGLMFSVGQFIVVMDDDLEDPPSFIPDLYSKIKEGFEVVYAIRDSRKVSVIKTILYATFYRVIKHLSDISLPNDAGDFCIVSRAAVDALLQMPERNRYIRGMRAWVGFKQIGIPYERGERLYGSSGFNFFGYVKFALNGIFSFSYKPLHYITVLGILSSLVSVILISWIIVSRLFFNEDVAPGFALSTVSTLFVGSIQLLSIGILGQYIARIYDEVKQRPNYIVKMKSKNFK